MLFDILTLTKGVICLRMREANVRKLAFIMKKTPRTTPCLVKATSIVKVAGGDDALSSIETTARKIRTQRRGHDCLWTFVKKSRRRESFHHE